MPEKVYDYIIVGQGLAGSLMAFELLEAGKSVFVFDNDHPNSSSRVAAGMWNPVTFKRMNLAWKVPEALNIMQEVYPKMEQLLDAKFFHSRPIKRIFPDEESFDQFVLKSDLPLYAPYLGETVIKDDHAPHGCGMVEGGGYVDLQTMMAAMRHFLERNGDYQSVTLSDNDFAQTKSGWKVGSVEGKAVVCCRGVHDLDSRFWSFLPLKQTKGEVVTLRVNLDDKQTIVNNGKFALPLGEDRVKLGSTYVWDKIDEEATEKGKEQIVSKFKEWCEKPFEVCEHVAGIRPTVKDRRPLAGKHPEFENLYLLNGLGTRGVLIGPWCAKNLVSHLLSNQPLDREINLARFSPV